MTEEQPKKGKRRKWSLTEAVTKIADSEGFDIEEFGTDLLVSGLSVQVYGQDFTDPYEADRLKKIKKTIQEELKNKKHFEILKEGISVESIPLKHTFFKPETTYNKEF